MAVVWIPALMRKLTGGQERVSVGGSTLKQVIDNLEADFPGFRDRLCDGDRIRPNIAAVIDGEVTRMGLLQGVKEDSEIHFVPAVSGGSPLPKIAFLFPGQGSQYVGMGKELYDNFKEARETYEQADEILGFKVSDLCFNGPADRLKETVITQPAIYTTSVACYRVLKSKGVKPEATAGHSVGEYAALTAAGATDFATGLRLVKKRGESIQKAAALNPGTMGAIIGLSEAEVRRACEGAANLGIVEVANFNSPEQMVISGEREALEKALGYAKEYGAKRTVLLEVSGAFHSSLMRPAREEMAQELARTDIKDPELSVVANVTADYVKDGKSIKELLAKQIDSSVLWSRSMERLVRNGYDTMIEVGPGKVLGGLMRRISKEGVILNAEDVKSIESTLQALL